MSEAITLEALEAQVLTITPETLERVPGLREPAQRFAEAQAEERRARVDLDQAEARLRATHESVNALNRRAVELGQELRDTREAALDALLAGREDQKLAARLSALESSHKLIMAALELLASQRVPDAQRAVRAAQADVLEAEARVLACEIEIRQALMMHYLAPLAVLEGGQAVFESPSIQRLNGRIARLLEMARDTRERR